MTLHPKDLQLQFLQKIKHTLLPNMSLVDELAEVLGTSNDSAYRRMRGETLFNIEELTKLCIHFKVGFEIGVQPNAASLVTFSYNKLKDEPDGFKTWFLNLYEHIRQIADSPSSKIIYAADDVPVWHHFNNDQLIAFKLFYWQKSILNLAKFKSEKFNPDLIEEQLIAIGRKILTTYNTINSTEIWSEDTLNSTLKQIEYFWDNDFFENKKMALSLCDAIKEEVLLLKAKVETESKNQLIGGDKNFSFYQSEVMLGNNSIIVESNQHKMAFVSNNTFNIMHTANRAFVAENEMWMNNIMKKSILISGINEKQRNRFFRLLLDKVSALEHKID